MIGRLTANRGEPKYSVTNQKEKNDIPNLCIIDPGSLKNLNSYRLSDIDSMIRFGAKPKTVSDLRK